MADVIKLMPRKYPGNDFKKRLVGDVCNSRQQSIPIQLDCIIIVIIIIDFNHFIELNVNITV